MTNRQKTVLVIDDDETLASSLVEMLTRENFASYVSRDGEAGLADALKLHPDLILLDILLPKMDGFSVLKKLREDVWGKDVPVIILTNLSEPKNIAATVEDASDYLVKVDWRLEEVIAKVKERLGL